MSAASTAREAEHVECVHGAWWGRRGYAGKRIRLGTAAEFRSRTQARAAFVRYLELERPQTLSPGPHVRATAYFERFLQVHVALYRPTTRRQYRSAVRKHLVPGFGGKRLAEIDAAVAQAWIARLAPRRSRGTVRGLRNCLLQILRQARRDGFAAHRIAAADLRLPSQAKAERAARWISDAELRQILEASPWPWRALWAVLGFAGLRIGEGLGLTWSHVDFADRSIRLRQACVGGELAPLKTATSRADLPMLPQLERILLEYRAAWTPNPAGLLFASRRGTPLRSDDVRRRYLHPLLEELKLPRAGTHSFRHGLPSRLVQAGCSPTVIQTFMRHANAAETARYTHVGGRDLRDAIEAAAKRLPGNEERP